MQAKLIGYQHRDTVIHPSLVRRWETPLFHSRVIGGHD